MYALRATLRLAPSSQLLAPLRRISTHLGNINYMPSLCRWLRTKAAPDLSRHVLRAPEKHAQQEKRNWSHHCVANDSDIPDLHVRKWHTNQPRKTQNTTDNHQNPHRCLQPAVLEYRCREEH